MGTTNLPPGTDSRQLDLFPGFTGSRVEQCQSSGRPKTLRQQLRSKARVPDLFCQANDNDQNEASKARLRKAGLFEELEILYGEGAMKA